jgi:hypothetical protein
LWPNQNQTEKRPRRMEKIQKWDERNLNSKIIQTVWSIHNPRQFLTIYQWRSPFVPSCFAFKTVMRAVIPKGQSGFVEMSSWNIKVIPFLREFKEGLFEIFYRGSNQWKRETDYGQLIQNRRD